MRKERYGVYPFSAPKRSYMLPMVAITLLCSIALAPRLKAGPCPILLALTGAALIIVLARLRASLLPGALIVIFAAGAAMTQACVSPALPEAGERVITGYVLGEADVRTESRMTFTLCGVSLDGEPAADAYCTLHTYGGEALPELFDGALLRFRGKVYHPSGKSGPHDFDFRTWLLTSGVTYGVSSIKELEILNTPDTAHVRDPAARARGFICGRLKSVMGDDYPLAAAMLLGSRDALAADERKAFQDTGIAHIMAVSGLHVGLLGGLLMLLLQKLRVGMTARLVAVGAFLFCYCALTGFSPAAVRAAVMLWLSLFGRATLRRPEPVTLLSAAMIAVLMINPLQLFTASFTLSFSAMAGILIITPQARKLLARVKLSGKLADMLSVSIGAQLGVLLPTAAYFNRLPLYGLLINLMIIPLAGFLVPLYALTLLVSGVPLLGEGMGFLAALLSRALLFGVKLMATLPYASVRVPSPAPIFLAAFGLGALAASRYTRLNAPRRVIVIICLAVICAAGARISAPPSLRYIQLSVGHGDAAIIMDGDKTIVIDAGEHGSEVADYMLSENRSIDALYITHLHIDHALGVRALLDEGIPIADVYLPEGAESADISAECLDALGMLRGSGANVTHIASGDKTMYNEASVTALWPMSGRTRAMHSANDFSMALLIELGGMRILTASDIPREYDAHFGVSCDVLKAAHHGSDDSSGEAFLSAASPGAVIVSCAAGSVISERLTRGGRPLLRTDESGDITITVADGSALLSPYR